MRPVIAFLVGAFALWLVAAVVPGVRVLGFGSGGALETILSFLLIASVYSAANGGSDRLLRRRGRPLPMMVAGLYFLALNLLLTLLITWASALLRFGLVVETWWPALVALVALVLCWQLGALLRLRTGWSVRRIALIGFAAATVASIAVSLAPRDAAVLLSPDGNFLFYNAPVAVPVGDGFALAYVSSAGLVMLDLWADGRRESSHIIHDHADAVLPDYGGVDDHSAPAVFHDSAHDRLLVATAYHGTDMYLYAFSLVDGSVRELSVWPGSYAYPRFIAAGDEVLLFARNQPPDIMGGDLVVRTSRDSFVDESVVVSAPDGFVVYAGTPASSGTTVYFSYTMHDYSEDRMIGYEVIAYDALARSVVASCDLESHLDGGYYSNRPTGLGVDDGRVMTGTSYSDGPLLPATNYTREETVLVLEGDISDCTSFASVVQRDHVPVPYYNNGVAINDHGHYLFFAGDEVVTNWPHPDCFGHTRNLYPNFLGDSALFFAAMNWPYSIRDFDNSLMGCFPD